MNLILGKDTMRVCHGEFSKTSVKILTHGFLTEKY